VFRTEILLEGTVKILSNIQAKTATPLNSRASHFILIFIVVSLSLLIIINNVYAAQITLDWDPNIESDLAGYKIYYGTSSRNYSKSVNIASPNITTCTISDLIEEQTYYFAATAYNSNLVESDYSVEVSYTINPATTSVPTTTTPTTAPTSTTTIVPSFTTTTVPATTTTTVIISTSTTTRPITTTSIGGGGGVTTSTTTTVQLSTSTTTVLTTTTTVLTTTTTVPVSECIIESVESTVLSLQSGLLKPRLRRIVITSTNSKWDDSSKIKINDINFVIRLRVEHDMITALILIPPRLLGFQPGVKDVTIVTGSEACIGTVEIE
jgi:hypothetical protein